MDGFGLFEAACQMLLANVTRPGHLDNANLARVDSILGRLDLARINIQPRWNSRCCSASRTYPGDKELAGWNRRSVKKHIVTANTILQDMQRLQDGVGAIIETGDETTQNALRITELGEDRLDGFLQKACDAFRTQYRGNDSAPS